MQNHTLTKIMLKQKITDWNYPIINTIFMVLLITTLSNNNLVAAEYKIAIRAHNGIEQANKKWTATALYLSENIPEHNFKLVPIVNLNELTAAAGRAEFDFVLTNPSSYVEINNYHDTKAIATLNNKRANTTQARFGSVIFVHAANDNIINVKDLQSRSLMAVSKSAFGGWLVAWLELQKQGINPYKDFSAMVYSKNSLQQEVVYAVRDRKVDAGVVRTDQLERMESSGKVDMRNFRILNNKDIKDFPFFLSTDLYPEWAFATMKNTPEKLTQQVQQKLFSIPFNSQAALKGKYIGWVAAKDYSSVEKLMQQLKVGPFSPLKK